jgi:hypothetical protein
VTTRRAWAQLIAGAFAALRARAQVRAFPGDRADALRALAAAILPGELGRAGTDRIADRFGEWVRGYRAGADTEHGYGFPRVRSKPDLPVARYLQQLDALGRAPTAAAVAQALEEAKITALPGSPSGAHIAADLLSFYFNSADANDLCYRARIGRDACRGLTGSDRPPQALGQ